MNQMSMNGKVLSSKNLFRLVAVALTISSSTVMLLVAAGEKLGFVFRICA